MLDSSLHTEPVTMTGGDGRRFGAVARSVAGYTLVLALMFSTPLFVFIPAALLYCGIRNGRTAAWVTLALGAIVAAALAFVAVPAAQLSPTEVRGHWSDFTALILAVGIPALLVLPRVEREEAFGRVLMLALVASVAGMFVTEASMRLAAGFSPFAEEVRLFQESSAVMAKAYQSSGMPADAVNAAVGFVHKTTDVLVYCLTGAFLVLVSVMFTLSLMMVGRLRAWRTFVRTRQITGTPYLFRKLSLPDWLLFAFVLAGLSPLATGVLRHIGANVLAIVIFLYLLQGLAIFRSLLATVGAGFIGVMFAYAMLLFLTMTGIAPLLLSIAGLFDSFFDFRHFNRKDDSNESHID